MDRRSPPSDSINNSLCTACPCSGSAAARCRLRGIPVVVEQFCCRRQCCSSFVHSCWLGASLADKSHSLRALGCRVVIPHTLLQRTETTQCWQSVCSLRLAKPALRKPVKDASGGGGCARM